jgi:hypothetical protein
MKHFFTFSLLLVSTLAFAQWTKVSVPADELLGRLENSTFYQYHGKQFVFSYEETDKEHFAISTNQMLDIKLDNYWYGCVVRVGLYDSSDKLIEGFDMFLASTNNTYTEIATVAGGKMSVPVGQHKKAKKIISHLHSVGAYVRFIIPTYSNGKLDARVYAFE